MKINSVFYQSIFYSLFRICKVEKWEFKNIRKKDAGAALNAANSKRDGFPDLVFDDDDDLEFANSVSWETVEAEAFLLLSCLSTPSRICWRQIMFQRRIFSNVSFGNMYFILSCFLCFHNMFLSFMFPLFFCFFWSKVTSFWLLS